MSLTKFLDPKNDVAFKKIFGTEKNKDILIHFLNDMLVFKEQKPIVDVSFLKTVQDPDISSKKTSVVDVLCTDQDKNTYVVEMQVASHSGFEKRAQYYASKAYTSQANKGGEYHHLKEVIFIAISDFIMFPDKEAYKSDHVILDRDSYENDLKDFSFTFIELPKFNIDIDHLSNMTQKWCYFFKHAETTSMEDMLKLISGDEILEKAYKVLDSVLWNDDELRTYNQTEKYEGAYHASMAQKFDEGKIEGKIEGIEEGKRNMARSMLQRKLDVLLIADITGFTLDQISRISQE